MALGIHAHANLHRLHVLGIDNGHSSLGIWRSISRRVVAGQLCMQAADLGTIVQASGPGTATSRERTHSSLRPLALRPNSASNLARATAALASLCMSVSSRP